MGYGSSASYAGLCYGSGRSAIWLPLDLVLEDAMDGHQIDATSEIEKITGERNRYFLPLFKKIFLSK